MSQATKGRLNYRCPQCFSRDIDMDLFYDAKKDEYYCLRCCFRGSEEKILKMNEQIKDKYGLIMARIDSFGDDAGDLEYHTYQKGEL
ncbi:MAG: hypothetical protein LUE20_06935 [Oscillospiraceae bacterium]|nr:hypothetical protein [Oscillospiraceae bacterium]